MVCFCVHDFSKLFRSLLPIVHDTVENIKNVAG